MRQLLIPFLAALTLAACAGGPGRQTVAVVNGEKITAADVAAMLPENLDSLRADTVKKQVLDGMITRKLFAQEAKREGMEKDAEYEVELEQKALLNQKLYDTITAPGNNVNEMAVQTAYKKAAEVPLETASRCREIIEILVEVGPRSNPSARSDIAVGIRAAKAGLDGALENVLVNLSAIKDETFVKEMKAKTENVLSGLGPMIESVIPR